MSEKSKLKQLLVRFPDDDDEVSAVEALFATHPGASAPEIVRALLHCAKPVQVTNALAKYAAFRHSKGGPK